MSGASYVGYNLSGQKFIKNAKNGPFFEKNEVCSQTVLPDILGNFQTMWMRRTTQKIFFWL